MFKIAILVSCLFTAVNAMAAYPTQPCQAEAQVIAPIVRIEKSMTSCEAFVDAAQARFFSSSIVCPLDLAEIAVEGVEVGLQNGHDCKLDVGADLNGVVVRRQTSGLLVLE